MKDQLNLNNFESEVINSDISVVVEFYTTWCESCKANFKILEDISKTNKCKLGKVDITDEHELKGIFNVKNIPTSILFKHGKVKAIFVGILTEEMIKELKELIE